MLIEVQSTTSSAPGGDPRTFCGKIYGQEKNLTACLHRPHEPRAPRHRGLPDRPRGHPAQPRLPTGTGASHLRLRHRQSAVLAEEMGPRVWEADPWGRAASASRRKATATTPGSSTWSPPWRRPATGRVAVVLPQGALFRKAPRAAVRGPPQAGPHRGGYRPGPEPLLRHRLAARVADPSRAKPARAEGKGARHRRLEPLPQGPRPELPGPEHSRNRSSIGYAPSRTSKTAPRSVASTRSRRKAGRFNISRYVLPPSAGTCPVARGRRGVRQGSPSREPQAEDHLRTY